MALPTQVQVSAWTDDVANVVAITFATFVSGNTIVVGVSQNSGTARTYAITDSLASTYNLKQRIASGNVAEIWEAHNVIGTSVVITITASAGSNFSCIAAEIGNLGTSDPSDDSDQNTNTITTDHFCAPSGQIDTSPDVYVFCIGTCNSVLGAATVAGSGYTSLGLNASELAFAQSRISASALTDERGNWTSENTRTTICCIASFKAPTSANPFVTQLDAQYV